MEPEIPYDRRLRRSFQERQGQGGLQRPHGKLATRFRC